MGAWGTAITANDTVSDVRDFMVERLKAGATLAEASAQAAWHFRELESDSDDGPLLWQGIASIQWKYGRVNRDVLQRVRSDIQADRGLDLWREDPTLLAKRRTALAKFLETIKADNPRPSPLPKTVVRSAPFAEGDCLAVRTEDGRYTAALVLKVNNENPELGLNLVAGLDYLAEVPPDLAFFEQRKWLFKHHGKWTGEPDLLWFNPVRFRQTRSRITIVGTSAIRRTDPKDARGHAGWNLLGQQILLCREASK
jgi:hypothetical protein